MNIFFVAYQVYKDASIIGFGAQIVYCSCGFGLIMQVLLEQFNARNKWHEAENITVTSLSVLDPNSAAQLGSDNPNVIRISE